MEASESEWEYVGQETLSGDLDRELAQQLDCADSSRQAVRYDVAYLLVWRNVLVAEASSQLGRGLQERPALA